MSRFDNFLSRLPAGVQLFALLRQHDSLRQLLVSLMASSPRMAEAVIHRAHVMDGLIDPAFADEVRRRRLLVSKVAAFLEEARDYQDLIERARIIGQEQKFLISASSPGSWWPNWSQGKPSTTSPRSRYFRQSFSSPVYCGVRPHFEATLTTSSTLPR